MAKAVGEVTRDIMEQVARLLLDAEHQHFLASADPGWVRHVPCADTPIVAHTQADVAVRDEALRFHARAQDASSCLSGIERIRDEVDAIQLPSGISDAGREALQRVHETLDEVEREIEREALKLRAELWRTLPAVEARDRAARLLRELEQQARLVEEATDARTASNARQAWHRAASLVETSNEAAPSLFRAAGFNPQRHLGPPVSRFTFTEFLADG